MKRLNGGNTTLEGFAILACLIIIVFVSTAPGTKSVPHNNTPLKRANSNPSIAEAPPKSVDSSYSGDISIGTGNAKYSFQSYEEYITLSNKSDEPINITGWRLRNGKGGRTFDLGGNLRRFPDDSIVIPQATPFISPTGNNTLGNIVLKRGETAIITTGSMGSKTPYPIVSFKENKCSGYLEDLPQYTFTPRLSSSCPSPENEPGVEGLPNECRNFIEGMRSCRIPEFDTRNRDGEICRNCVDGEVLPSSCVAFIKRQYNYGSCVANHQNDPDFYGRTWRVFLGNGWEMWAEEYETIELFDQYGRLVDSKSY